MSSSDRPKREHPYAHAPRLPVDGPIDTESLTIADKEPSSLGAKEAPPIPRPIEIEIGPGRGAFLVERASEREDVRLVGLEIRWKWAALVDERLARLGVGHRARVFAADARLVLPRLHPDASVAAFFIHFPDPWWKKRQRKRLVVTPQLVEQVVRLLQPEGMLFVQTDVAERAEAYEALLSNHADLRKHGDSVGSARISLRPWAAVGNRERRADEAGIPVFRLRYARR